MSEYNDYLAAEFRRLEAECDDYKRAIEGLLRQIDEMRRLPEEEDPIAVSQQFDLEQKGPWIVHGRNGNREPKIACWETREAAEHCAEKVRRVIAEAVAPWRKRVQELEKDDERNNQWRTESPF